MIVISCLLLKRLRKEPLPARQFSLGRWGIAINIAALCYLAPLFVFAFFPAAVPVNPTTMNWAVVMFFGIIGFAVVYYFTIGHKHYVPPVALVKRDVYER